jgi:uncharacterized membrane protein YfcA
MNPGYAFTGLLVGFLIGLTGMGGGSLMTPILILLIGIKPSVAVGSDLAYAAITKITAASLHRRQGTINYPVAYRLAMGSVPGSLLAVYFMSRIHTICGSHFNDLISRMLGFMLVFVGIVMFLKGQPFVTRYKRYLCFPDMKGRAKCTVMIGLVVGFLVGATSVGSGALFGVLLLTVYGMAATEMVGTDVFHAAILSSCAAAGHLFAGNVDYSLVGNLLIGSIPGALLGSRLVTRMPAHLLRTTLGGVLLLSGLKMI